LSSEKIHSSCCAAGVGGEKTVTGAADSTEVVCTDLQELYGELVVFLTPHIEGNGLTGNRDAASQVSCSQAAMTFRDQILLTPT